MVKKIITTSPRQTQEFASRLLSDLDKTNIVILIGDLGSGKTTFVQGLGKALGFNRVISPTYLLIRQYPIRNHPKFQHLYHIDLYRLVNQEEILDLGLSEIWSDEKNLVLIEWPEKVQDLLPRNTIRIHFTKTSENSRRIEIS